MRSIMSIIIVFTIVPTLLSQTQSDYNAKAAMILATAKVKVVEKATIAAKEKAAHKEMGCFEDYNLAKAEAEKTGKKLVVWLGMNCASIPNVAASLKDCVNCHLEKYQDYKGPALLVMDGDTYYWFAKDEIGSRYTIKDIRRYIDRPVKNDNKVIQSIPTFSSGVQMDCSTGTCQPVQSQRGRR